MISDWQLNDPPLIKAEILQYDIRAFLNIFRH
jgi:hypothetical protein